MIKNEYDVSTAFQEIEKKLIESMSRNLGKHLKDQATEGFDWTMWQAEQLKSLRRYRSENSKEFNGYFSTINKDIDTVLNKAKAMGTLEEEQKILKALQRGYRASKTFGKGVEGAFLKVNDRKMNALVQAVTGEMKRAETAVLRMANDKYRKTIFNAQVYANTSTGTVWQAVDMATKDFLGAGVNCIEYADGRRVNIASYAEMAIRTANKRAFLLGEGSKRDEWGIHTVLVSQYGACSPTCLPWQGKVYIDDVYSSGKADGKYPLLSTAISGGLFHPNCRHTISTFFEGVNTVPDPKDVEGTTENNALEQKQRYNERQIRRYKRLENGSLTSENVDKYKDKRVQWQKRQRKLIADNPDILRRDYARESTRGILERPPEPPWKPPVVIEPPTPLMQRREASFVEKITAVKEKVLKNGSVIEETHLKEAGKAVISELNKNAEIIKISENVQRLEKEKKDLFKAYKDYIDPGSTQISERDNLYDEWKKKKEEYKEQKQRSIILNADILKTKLSEVREVGYGSINVTGHLNNSRSPMRKIIERAYDVYPTDWVQKSVDKSNLTPKKVQRGFYSSYRKVIAISDRGGNEAFATAIHELGHRFEDTLPEIVRSEKSFYNRRTAGEKLTWLGVGYDRSEKTRFDKFLNKYMGKDYGGSSYEIVSMGFEMAYTEPVALLKDKDMAELIFGILAIL
ncbi:MAG: phage minor capsid protein [Eubacterium sp.]